ncbi:MAG: T9SS type A sorting domain-containing protein [FCB group bacterium]|nr:T9SS type A sorting domain-containing protein [FCB group bacterium]
MKSNDRWNVIFVLLFWTVVLGTNNLAAQVEYPGPVNILGPEEIVFDWSADSCEEVDIPDAPARAFRDADGKVQLIATHYINRRMIGDNINNVKRDCNVIMDSDLDTDPSQFNDHEWLMAPYTLDGSTIYALVHNEYQGDTWYNSITFATSTDKGATYTHATPPNHLVASAPYVYEPNVSPYGVFGGSNIILNPNDGYYYVLFQVEAYGLQDWGVAVARTLTLDDPASWRAWDGSGFNVQFINPYLNPNADPAEHIVQPISRDQIDKMQSSITYNTFFKKFVLVGPHVGDDPVTGNLVYGFFYSFSDDLINWSRAQIIKEAKLWWTPWLSGDAYHYPSLIDTSDTTRNFEVTGQQAYLYYTRNHEGTTYDRDLVRIPIEFTRTLVEAFTVNSTGDGEDLNQGDGICDDGTGDCTLRAAIQESNNNPSNTIIPIKFDIPGTGPHTIQLSSYLPALTKPAFIDGYSQPGSSPNTLPFNQGDNAVLMIEIDGSNTGGAWGLTIRADSTTVRGIAINQSGTDIVLDNVMGNVIQGNFIGTDITGTSNPGAGGLSILGSANNLIGGTADSTRNVIVGSVMIQGPGANNNVIQGNYIGTDATGTQALNMSSGIAIQDSAQNNTIVGNLISGNHGHGIFMSGYEVRGNSILENLIGTDRSGINSLGNGLNGIAVNDGSQNNIIGAPGQGNIIADSGDEGILLTGSRTTGNLVQSNQIGTDTTGTINLGNGFRGIFLMQDTGDNIIGGIEDGEGNIIAFNGDVGVGLLSNVGTGNAILSNSIYANGLQGIDLGLDGLSYNDDGDGDVGANNLQNYPELFAAARENIVRIAGTLNSLPNTSYRIEFFLNGACDPSGYGEGEEFIDFASVTTNGSGNANFYVTLTADVNLAEYITATTTDPDGNSSEFSQCVEVTVPESRISAALDIFTYSLNVGQTTTEILTISNMGSSILEWAIESATNWISTDPDSGTVVPGITDSIMVIIDASNLDEGYYVDTLLISSNDPNTPLIRQPVSLFVTAAPEIVVAPDSFMVDLDEGTTGRDTLIIRNAGIATLNWTVGWTYYSPWLSAGPTSGTTEPGDSALVTITIDAVDSTAGIYDGVLIVNSDDPNTPNINVPVTLTITEVSVAGILVTPGDSISVSIIEGETFAKTLIIENIGTADLEWVVNRQGPWLSVYPDSGRTEPGGMDSLVVLIDGSELVVGFYIDTLSVFSNDVNNPTIDILVVVDVTALGNNEISELPKQFKLMQNYPNPFNPTTTFQYELPEQVAVTLVVYDILGKKIKTLVRGVEEPGLKSAVWDGTNDFGEKVSAGVYLYWLRAGDFSQTRKMVVLK